MEATYSYNYSLRSAQASDPKVKTPDQLLSRQTLQRIATRMVLVSEAIGFSIVGILIIMNRNQADRNGLGGVRMEFATHNDEFERCSQEWLGI